MKKAIKRVSAMFMLSVLLFTEVTTFNVGASELQEEVVMPEITEKSSATKARTVGDVVINATNFPDAKFRELIKWIDTDNDGKLSVAERDACTEIDVRAFGIGSIRGIEFFGNLKILLCNQNNITSLDLSNNPKLTELYCFENKLTSLDLSKNSQLSYVDCQENALTSLKLGNNPKLSYLMCDKNALTSLNLSNCPSLKEVSCAKNKLTQIVMGVSVNKLVAINCSNNNLKSIPDFKNSRLNTMGERIRTSFQYNEIPEKEFRNKLPKLLLEETEWLNQQISTQRVPATKYKITFNENGGSVKTKSKTVTNGATYGALPTGTRKNYTLKGWYTAKTGGTRIEAGTKVNLTKNQTLYAQWSLKKYKIQYKANKGSGTMKETTLTHGKSKKLTANAFKRKGYTFTGWNTKANGKGTAYKNKESLKNKKLTLYAQWKKNTYTVKFKGNKSTSGKMNDLKMSYGASKKLTANAFKRTGYKFVGWNTKANGKGTTYKNKASVKNKNLTLYAQWRKKTAKK